MKICPTCKTKYSTNVFYCPLEGSKLDDDVEAGPSKSIIGTILDDRYRIVSKLGEGGMGAVYMVEHVILKKQMAAKILRDEFARKEDLVKRFQMEAVAASRIGQENIVDVTDFGRTSDGNVYFVMEVLDGPNLAQLIKQESGIAAPRAIPILVQVCRALHSAHKQGIIHRDLKPENIVLIKRGETPDFVKILDFGISKMIDTGEGRTEKLTALGMIVGTPEYMSPEQASGGQVDLRTDIYSLGIIMYEMVTGRLPFAADNALKILVMHQTEEAVPPRTLRPDLEIPSALEQVILRAMSKKREVRQQSMEEVGNDLFRVAGDGRAVSGYEPRKTMAWDSAVGALPGISLSGVTPIGERRPSKTQAMEPPGRPQPVQPVLTPVQQPPIQIPATPTPVPVSRTPVPPAAGRTTPGQMPVQPVPAPAVPASAFPAPDIQVQSGSTGWQETTSEVLSDEVVTVVAPSPYARAAAEARPAPVPAFPAEESLEGLEPALPRRSRLPLAIAAAAVVLLGGGAAAAYFLGAFGGNPAPAAPAPIQSSPKPETQKPVEAAAAKKEGPQVTVEAAKEGAEEGEPAAAPQAGKKTKKKDMASAGPAGGGEVLVTVDVESSPSTAEIYRGQNFIGITPAKIRGRRGEQDILTFKKSGYAAQTVTVKYDRARTLHVDLKSSGTPAPPPPKKKDDLFDKIDDIKNPFK
ncbi:MAG: protein kinase [Deltaproteobacteria bacterium]|nr:protein kinase [Deltaproteobacteria bacterium]